VAREYTHQQSKAEVFPQMPHQYLAGIVEELYPFEIPAIKYDEYFNSVKQKDTSVLTFFHNLVCLLPAGHQDGHIFHNFHELLDL